MPQLPYKEAAHIMARPDKSVHPKSPESLQRSIAANASWARCADRSARVAPANAGLDARIDREYAIPEDLKRTDPAEYARRHEAGRKAWFGRLALKSVNARRKAKQLVAEAAAAEAELAELGEAS